MVPNFLPYRGFGLKVLEYGGPPLVKEAFAATRVMDRPVDIGDVIWTKPHGVGKAQRIGFVIMPYYWQGGKIEASRRLRYVIKRAFEQVQQKGIKSLAMPHLAGGLYGYEPTDSGNIIFDEMVESLLQIDEVEPKYSLRDVTIMDQEMGIVEKLKESLEDV